MSGFTRDPRSLMEKGSASFQLAVAGILPATFLHEASGKDAGRGPLEARAPEAHLARHVARREPPSVAN